MPRQQHAEQSFPATRRPEETAFATLAQADGLAAYPRASTGVLFCFFGFFFVHKEETKSEYWCFFGFLESEHWCFFLFFGYLFLFTSTTLAETKSEYWCSFFLFFFLL